MGPAPGGPALTFTSSLNRLGSAVQAELTHRTPSAEPHGARLPRSWGVQRACSDGADGSGQGLREIQPSGSSRRPAAWGSHWTTCRQVRAAFFGEEALKVQRGRDGPPGQSAASRGFSGMPSDVEAVPDPDPVGGGALREVAEGELRHLSPHIRRRETGSGSSTGRPRWIHGGEGAGGEPPGAEVLPGPGADAPSWTTASAESRRSSRSRFGSLGRTSS